MDQQSNGQSPVDAQAAAAHDDAFAEHPELYVGAALLGGLVLAKVLKRLGGGD
jgi:hypothetical protein